MQTRSASRKVQKTVQPDGVVLVVSPSATGQGTHRRWYYPTSPSPAPAPTQRAPPLVRGGASSGSSSEGSCNSLFYGSLSSLSSVSSAHGSFECAPEAPAAEPLPVTPPRPTHQPKPLTRSPLVRWKVEGTTHRLILVPDDVAEDAQKSQQRERQEQEQISIFEREYQRLLQRKDDFEMDSGDSADIDESDEDMADESGSSKPSNRLTNIVEESESGSGPSSMVSLGGNNTAPRASSAPRRTKALGPEGTELIFNHSLLGSGQLSVNNSREYPKQWVAEPSNALRRRPTDILL